MKSRLYYIDKDCKLDSVLYAEWLEEKFSEDDIVNDLNGYIEKVNYYWTKIFGKQYEFTYTDDDTTLEEIIQAFNDIDFGLFLLNKNHNVSNNSAKEGMANPIQYCYPTN